MEPKSIGARAATISSILAICPPFQTMFCNLAMIDFCFLYQPVSMKIQFYWTLTIFCTEYIQSLVLFVVASLSTTALQWFLRQMTWKKASQQSLVFQAFLDARAVTIFCGVSFHLCSSPNETISILQRFVLRWRACQWHQYIVISFVLALYSHLLWSLSLPSRLQKVLSNCLVYMPLRQ